jgi:predicted dehydrogenase
MPNKPVRTVAVIGAGSIGSRHLRNLEQLGVERLLVCEPDSTQQERLQAELPAHKYYPNLEDTLEENPEAVIVASPSAYHEEHTAAALARRCAVLVEKPLSYRLGRTGILAQEAEDNQIITMVACNMRFHPGPATVHRLLNAGAIGDLISYRVHTGSYLPDWRPHQDFRESYSASVETGGAILDCIHELDLALWYAGPARLIAAKRLPGRPIGLETDGLAEALIQHETGALGSIHLNFIERDYRRSCVCIGTEGTLDWNFHRNEVMQFGRKGVDPVAHPLPDDWQINDMYAAEMRHFLDCVAAGTPTQNSIAQNLPCLKLALDIRASSL